MGVPPGHPSRKPEPAKSRQCHPQHGAAEGVLVSSGFVLEMRAAPGQSGKFPHLPDLAVRTRDFERFASVGPRRKGRGVSTLPAVAKRARDSVEDRRYFGRIGYALSGLALEYRPVVNRIEQADRDERRKHDKGGHPVGAPGDAPPGNEQVRLAVHMNEIREDRHDEQEHEHVGPEYYQHGESLIRTGPEDRPSCRKRRSAAGPRCTGPSRETPSSAPPRNPATGSHRWCSFPGPECRKRTRRSRLP